MKNNTSAILVDPFNYSIRKVFVSDIEDIRAQIVCDMFTCVGIGDNTLYLDDEGLINGTERAVRFVDEVYPQPLAGRILILGNLPNGDSGDCTLSEIEVKSLVKHCCDILPSEVEF